jgi:hypothetical protein
MAEPLFNQRPKLVRPTEETRRLSTLLAEEVLRWPDVKTRKMFGLAAVYRGEIIFGALPVTRAIESPTAIAYKLVGEKIKGWRLFELSDESGLRAALAVLAEAYECAG